MRTRFRAILQSGRRPMWREVVELALEVLGGEAELREINHVIEGFRPTGTAWWREAVRREAGEHFTRVRDGRFRLPAVAA